MKFTNIALSLALIGTMSLAMAEDATTTTNTTTTTETTSTDATTTTSVDAEIAAIQAAPAQERVTLMNQFKQKLVNMNQEERAAAIAALQEKMQANGKTFGSQTRADAQMAKENTKAMGEMTSIRARGHAQEMQMQANEHMNEMQNMNQHQTANQFMNMPGNTPANSMPMGAGSGAGSNFNMGH